MLNFIKSYSKQTWMQQELYNVLNVIAIKLIHGKKTISTEWIKFFSIYSIELHTTRSLTLRAQSLWVKFQCKLILYTPLFLKKLQLWEFCNSSSYQETANAFFHLIFSLGEGDQPYFFTKQHRCFSHIPSFHQQNLGEVLSLKFFFIFLHAVEQELN